MNLFFCHFFVGMGDSINKTWCRQVTQEREKWEEERQEKDKELFEVRSHLEEQRNKWEKEVKALLEKQAVAVEEVTNRLQMSHKEEISRLQERQRQEVGKTFVLLLVIYFQYSPETV